MFKHKIKKWIILVVSFLLSLSLFTHPIFASENTYARIHFIDTGNSDCIFIQSKEKNVLIDAGDNDDEQRIVNYLNQLKVKKIDYLVSTHPDADHCGGLDAAVSNFDIGQAFVSNGSSSSKTYRDFIYSLTNKGLTPAVPLENNKIALDKHNSIQFYNTKATGIGNNLSLVTLLRSGHHKFLFTGDAPKKVEKSILDQLPQVDVLKVSHHGSKTGTSQELLDKIKPQYAIIECGAHNKYHHPNQEVTKRLKKANIKILRTDKKGNIIFKSKNKKLTYKCTKTTSNSGSANVTRDPSDEIKKQEEAKRQAELEAQRQAELQAQQVAQRQAELQAQQEAQRQAQLQAQQEAQRQTQQQAQQNSTYVYIPRTGSKYHSNPNCSNMKNPTSIPLSQAQSQGYQPCSKCY